MLFSVSFGFKFALDRELFLPTRPSSYKKMDERKYRRERRPAPEVKLRVHWGPRGRWRVGGGE